MLIECVQFRFTPIRLSCTCCLLAKGTSVFSPTLYLLFSSAVRYMTAFTDSDEEELSGTEQGEEEQPTDKLCVLLERIDRMHQGTDSEKREGLNVLLEHREEVSGFTVYDRCQ